MDIGEQTKKAWGGPGRRSHTWETQRHLSYHLFTRVWIRPSQEGQAPCVFPWEPMKEPPSQPRALAKSGCVSVRGALCPRVQLGWSDPFPYESMSAQQTLPPVHCAD